MIFALIFFAIAFIVLLAYYYYNNAKASSIEKGKKLEKEGQYNEAVAQYEKVLTKLKDEEVLWRLANTHEKLGKKSMAISRLKELVVLKKCPVNVSTYDIQTKLGVLLFQSKKDEESFEYFLKLYKSHPKDSLILKYLIVLTLGQRRCDIASKLLNESLEIDDQEAETFFFMGVCFYEQKEYAKAKKMFISASDQSINVDWRFKFMEGITHYYTKNYDTALTCFNKTLSQPIPNSQILQELHLLTARCHYFLTDHNKALSVLDDARLMLLKINPEINLNILEEEIFANAISLNHAEKSQNALKALLDKEPESFRWNSLKETFIQLANATSETKEKLMLDEYGIEDKEGQVNLWLEEDKKPGETEKPGVKEQSEAKEPYILSEHFSGFLDYWKQKDILGDCVWKLSNLSREGQFDINKYFDVEMSGKSRSQKAKPNDPKQFKSLTQNSFLKLSRKILGKLNFVVLDEQYSSEEVFLALGDGANYLVYLKGSDSNEKYVIQIRRWESDSIGVLVLQELAKEVLEKKAKQGIFITTGELSPEAMDFVEKSKNINVIQAQQFNLLLHGIL